MRKRNISLAKIGASLQLQFPVLLGTIFLTCSWASAQESPSQANLEVAQVPQTEILDPGALERYVEFKNLGDREPMDQVTSVNQLRDVSPNDWAFEALRSLVERYGCIEGFPDQTYRGNRALTRYEFAAGLNACLNAIERLIAQSQAVLQEDLATLQRLSQEFSAELAALGARIDNLEGRVAFLEENQFSTTTKLVGEVAFTVAQAFGEESDAQAVLNDRVRLQLVTSFTGEDTLFTRLTAGNVGSTFQDEIGGTFEGRFAYDGESGNDITLDRLHYYFPVGSNLRIFTFASLGGHHFYADTFNPGLEAGGGANGALSRFGERNPIYRFGLGGQGVGFTYEFNEVLELSGGYLARGGNLPNESAGLFNGNYSALGQLVIQPLDNLKFGLTYLNNYDININGSERPFALGSTGTVLGNLQLNSLGVPNTSVVSNSYGVEGQFDITPNFSVRAYGGYIDAKLIGLGEAEIWTYALILAFPDLGREGSLGAVIFGAEPYLGGLDVPNDPDFENDTPFHVEALYRYALTDNISLTPGIIVLTAPNQSGDNEPVFIGALRTTFSF